MSWTPISGSAVQYMQDSVAANDHYIKFYASGTTTPISMATDSTGGTTLAKAQFNAQGYAINGSGDEFIPHIDQKYKVVFYPNATDADNNAFANAVYNIDLIDQVVATSDTVITTLTGTKRKSTVAAMTSDASAVVGELYTIEDYATGHNSGVLFFKAVASGTGIDDGGKYIDHDTLDVQFEQNMPAILNSKAWGMAESLADNSTKWQNAINFSVIKKQQLLTPAGTYVVKSTIDLPEGAQLLGDRKFKYHDGFGIDPLTTIIDFQPP